MSSISKKFFHNIRGDFFGGLTAGIVALPLALAFGEQTELGAIAGLYGAIAIGILAALVGGTPTLISGPTAPMTVVSALIISDAIANAGDLTSALPIIVATFILAGAIEALFGVFRLGKYIKYIPYPVVSGFMSGIGVIIIITQLFPFLGVSAPAGGPMGTIRSIHKIPEVINYMSVIIALATIAIIYLFPKISKKIPSTLIALIFVTIVVSLFLPTEAILKINSKGEIPSGLPALQLDFLAVFSDPTEIVFIFKYAFTLAALGAIDSLLTSLVADNMTKTQHDSNQELIGQGIGNMFSGLIGGLPGAGATMGTLINIRSGGKTKFSGVVAGMLLLAVLLGLGTLVGHIPNAVLAGILITVGFGIIDYKGIKQIQSVPKSDVAIMIIVLLLTVFVDLLVAVAVGMVLSSLLFMKKISDVIEDRTVAAPLKKFSRKNFWRDEDNITEELGNQVYIKQLEGPLFFGFASHFKDMVKVLPDIQVVIMRMDRVPFIDQSGLCAMEDVIMDFYKQDIKVVFTNLHGQPLDMFRRVHMIPNLISEKYCFEDFHQCLFWLKAYISPREYRTAYDLQSTTIVEAI